MGKKTYTGINIQYPISQLIIEGKKTIETRTYPIPSKYVNEKLIIIETPGKNGKFKSRMIGFIIFGESFQYKDKNDFYTDSRNHCVTPDSDWKWVDGKSKFGWPIREIVKFTKPLPLKKRSGIKFSTGIIL